MKSFVTSLMFMLICSTFIANNLSAQQIRVAQPKAGVAGTWRLLGNVQANFKADHDIIVVGGPYDYFRRLKFCRQILFKTYLINY